VQQAQTQLANSRKTCPELWQKFRDMYGDGMEFQIEIIAPKETQEGQEFDTKAMVKARPKAKEGEELKPMGDIPDAMVKQIRYSWIVAGKTQTGATPSLKVKADKEGEHTITVVVSRADLRQTPERLVEIGRKDTKITVTKVWKPTVNLIVPETGTTGATINMTADVVADKTQAPLLSLEWFVNGGLLQKGKNTTASFVPKDQGKHTVEVKVYLPGAGTEFEVAGDKKYINVTAQWKPTLTISGDSQGEAEKALSFKADVKADATAKKASRVEWVLENTGKVVGTGETLSFVPSQPGTYSVKAILYIASGGSEFPVATDSRRITVSDARKDKDKDGKGKDGKTDAVKQPPTCSFEYSEWGECSRATKKQTRSVTATKPEDCIEKQKPVLEQGCTPPPSEEDKKNSYLNCLCRCYCGWAGHIGVWYDPEGKSIPESPSTGPCFGGAGAFGNTRRHHFGAPNDCAKGCWEGAYGKGTYDPEKADKIRKEENKKHTKPIAVKIKPSKNPADFGDIVNLAAETSEGTGGYSWSWGGCAQDPKDNTAKVVNTRSCTSCAATVTATDQDGNSASDSVTIQCNAMKVKITKESPKENKLPIGSKATFLAEVFSGDKPAGGTFYYLWEHNPDATFGDDPKNPKFETQGGAQSRNTATFGKVGTIPVWVTVLKEVDGRKATIGESEQIQIEVSTPKLTLTADKKTPLIGETVTITVKEEPKMSDDIISFWWEIKGSATNPGPVPNVPNSRAYSFKPKDAKPVTVTVHGKAKDGGNDLGSSDMTITAQAYQVSISEPRYLESPPEIWQCDTQLGRAQSCGMVKLKPNQFTVHRDIFMNANVTPKPESPRYKWTVDPSGSCGSPGIGSEIKLNCGNTGTYTAKVEVTNAEGAKLGEASQSVTISISQEKLDGSKKGKEAYEKLQKAKAMIPQGKLDEAISLAGEAAKTDPRNTEAQSLLTKWKSEQDKVKKHAEGTKKLINESKIAEAEKELGEAKKLHPKYPPVIQAENMLKEAKKKEDDLKKTVTDKINQAKSFVAQGKLDEGISLVDEASKLDPKNTDAPKMGKQWRSEKDQVLKQIEKTTKLMGESKFADAQKELIVAKNLHGRYKPVTEIEKKLTDEWGKYNTTMRDRLYEIDSASKKKDYKKALELAKNIRASIKLDPYYDKELKRMEDFATQNVASYDNFVKQGADFEKQGKLKEALDKYQGARNVMPDPQLETRIKDIQTRLNAQQQKAQQAAQIRAQGEALQKQNKIPEAITKYKEYMQYVPNDTAMAKYVTDLETQQKVQQQKAQQAAQIRAQGEALQKQNRIPEAIAKYKEYMAYAPNDTAMANHIKTLEAGVAYSTGDGRTGRSYTSRPVETRPQEQPAGAWGGGWKSDPGPEKEVLSFSLSTNGSRIMGSWSVSAPYKTSSGVQKTDTLTGSLEGTISGNLAKGVFREGSDPKHTGVFDCTMAAGNSQFTCIVRATEGSDTRKYTLRRIR
jgi:tetratricopeptide (TPR) repeat protein